MRFLQCLRRGSQLRARREGIAKGGSPDLLTVNDLLKFPDAEKMILSFQCLAGDAGCGQDDICSVKRTFRGGREPSPSPATAASETRGKPDGSQLGQDQVERTDDHVLGCTQRAGQDTATTFAVTRPLRISDGKSAVRLSAYCRKAVFVRDLTGERCDKFSSSNVVHEELVIPPSSAEWAHEKYPSSPEGAVRLWNDIEIHEEFYNPSPTRICALELMIALPLELTLDENVSLSSTFARKSLTRRGYSLDLVIHDKPWNQHAHII